MASVGRPTVHVERTLHPANAQVGQVVACEIRVRLGGGPGLIEIHQALPDLFELTGGSNLHVLSKGLDPRETTLTFWFRATKRGDHEIPPLDVEVADPAGLLASRRFRALAPTTLATRPPLESFRRLRNVRNLPLRLLPRSAAKRAGPRTTAFQDIREYAWGDPPRSVNWKATARRLSRAHKVQHLGPLVNEYEREDRRNVWLLVDAARYMEVGTNVESVLDHTAEAAGTLSQYFLDRGFRVGAYLYNAVGAAPLYPDTGTAQRHRIAEALKNVVPDDPLEGLRAAVQRCRAHLVRSNPLVVVFTRVAVDPEDTLEGLTHLRGILGQREARRSILVVNVESAGLLTPRGDGGDPVLGDLGRVAAPLEAREVARLRARGVQVLSWDPRDTLFERVLLAGASK